MSSILNKFEGNEAFLFPVENLLNNARLFSRRFPELSKNLNLDSDEGVLNFAKKIPSEYCLEKTKLTHDEKDIFTLKINGKYLHSKYNPINEAEKLIMSDVFCNASIKNSCVFYGLGLGYIHELYVKQNPLSSLVIIEPDLFVFLLFLISRPLDDFFMHDNLTLLLGLYPKDVLDFFEAKVFFDVPFFKSPSLMEVNYAWFSEFETLKKRRQEKENLNKNTLKKFGKLWLKNFFKNKAQVEKLPGISLLKNFFKPYPCVITAAGPGLDEVLDIVKDKEDKFIIIAADTAVRACLRKGINPDFIILMDAQYWNYLHLADLDISDSILITESSVYPAVFRIKTKAKFLCTSMFPLAQYIEEAIGEKGKLITGGSVATAAWDFARLLGCSEIIFAGLDLAFTDLQTHFKGSRFEEDINSVSSRFFSSEAASHLNLYSASPQLKEGYNGKVLSDKRMEMYAWWFESKIAEFPDIKTYKLLPLGLKIPNMPVLSKEEFLIRADNSSYSAKIKKEKLNALCLIKNGDTLKANKRSLDFVMKKLKTDMEETRNISKEAMNICKNILECLKSKKYIEEVFFKDNIKKLNSIDEKIKKNKTNAIIGFDLLLSESSGKNINSKALPLLAVYEENFLLYKKIYEACDAVTSFGF